MLNTSPMSLPRHAIIARLALLFFIANLLSQPIFMRPAQGAEPAAPFKPPWTEERVKPPETENQEPLAWCDNTRERKRPDGTVESYNDFRVTYANGTEVRYEYGASRERWIVIVRGPQGRTRTTYDLTDEKKPTRTVEEPGKPPVTTEWKEAVEALKKKGAFLFDPFGSRLVSASYPVSPGTAEAVPEPERILLAATAPREQTPPTPKTPERPTINIKPVTYGGPLDPPPVIHLDPGPAITPEEFARTLIGKDEPMRETPPAVPLRKLDPWEIEARDRLEKFATPGGLAVPRYGLPVPRWGSGLDSQGPVTWTSSPPDRRGTIGRPATEPSIPVTWPDQSSLKPGDAVLPDGTVIRGGGIDLLSGVTVTGGINIGSGWASATVPGSFAGGCSGGPEPVVDSVVDDLVGPQLATPTSTARKSTVDLQRAADLAQQALQAAQQAMAAAERCDEDAFYALSKKAKTLNDKGSSIRSNVYANINPGIVYGGWSEEETKIDADAFRDMRAVDDLLKESAKRMLGCTPKR